MVYAFGNTECNRHILVILDDFFPFSPLTNQKIKILKKKKKTFGDTILLHMRTMNDNHDVWFLRYRGVAN